MSTGKREPKGESDKLRTMPVTKELIYKVRSAIEAALVYEEATAGRRKLGITGEVGEILACHRLGLRLVLDSRAVGFDAVDIEGAQVQIKTRRGESKGLPRDMGRTSRFSLHAFDYFYCNRFILSRRDAGVAGTGPCGRASGKSLLVRCGRARC
jgi:hypothetical protein